jgi:8-oxo-dGTP pyrophosphatase MutT (NUDIX family)
VPAPSEAAAKAAFAELLANQVDPMSRHAFVPGHVTAGAVVVADGHLLLIHHRRLGIWIEPGGHVDPDDATVEDAATRELVEETGINAALVAGGIFDLDVHHIPAAKGEPNHRHFNVCYLFEASLDEPQAADEVLAARWVRFEDVSGLTGDPAVLRVVARLQDLYRL